MMQPWYRTGSSLARTRWGRRRRFYLGRVAIPRLLYNWLTGDRAQKSNLAEKRR